MIGDLRIYYTRAGNADPGQARRLLTDDDVARLEQLSSERRRLEYVTGRALLRRALQDYTGRPARDQRLRLGHNGKPECVGGPAFSVSHSRGIVVCAMVSRGEIGIDIEFPNARRDTAAIAREFFSASEHGWLGGQSTDRFYMLWVLKEAYAKATGRGLAGGLNAFECFVEPPSIAVQWREQGERPRLALYGIDSGFFGIATTADADPSKSAALVPFFGGTRPTFRWIASA